MGIQSSKDHPPHRGRDGTGTHQLPLDEIRVLAQHTDIIRSLTLCGEGNSLLLSCSDDGDAMVWDNGTGECLFILKGHTRPVTCALKLSPFVVVTGSSDKTIRMWDISTGRCLHTLTGHNGAVKCLSRVDASTFCSGGNDRHIILWRTEDGQKIGVIERQEEENLHCLLPISNHRLATGSNSALMLVYDTNTLQFSKLLAYHRESVRSLCAVNDKQFASGSLDGIIVVWQSESLTPLKILHHPDRFKNAEKIFVYNVRKLSVFHGRFLGAAIGSSLRVYDIKSGNVVFSIDNAHDQEITDFIVLYYGTRLVTSSSDGTIKLWSSVGAPLQPPMISTGNTSLNIIDGNGRIAATTTMKELRPPGIRTWPSADLSQHNLLRTKGVESRCSGEINVHCEEVTALVPLSESSFASSSGDGTVVIFTDGRSECEARSCVAASVLNRNGLGNHSSRRMSLLLGRHTVMARDDNSTDVDSEDDSQMVDASDDLNNVLFDGDPQPVPRNYSLTPPVKKEPPSRAGRQFAMKRVEGGSKPPQATDPSVQVPEYIIDFAEMLRREKGYSVEQICTHLRELGHSESIVRSMAIRMS